LKKRESFNLNDNIRIEIDNKKKKVQLFCQNSNSNKISYKPKNLVHNVMDLIINNIKYLDKQYQDAIIEYSKSIQHSEEWEEMDRNHQYRKEQKRCADKKQYPICNIM
jgi:hypothetical protein